MTINNKATVALFCTAFIWSTGGVMIKWVEWNPLAVAGVRSLIAAFVIAICFRRQPLRLGPVVWGGAVAYCSAVTLFVIATKMTTAANAILLQYTAPLYVALFGGWLLGEPAKRRDWIAIFFVFLGMVFFFFDRVNLDGMIGNLCAVGSGIAYAFLFIFMRRQKDESPYSSILLGNGITFLLTFPFWGELTLSVANLTAMAYLGVVQLGLAYVLYSWAISYVKALDAVLITTLEPILNPLWVFFILGEVPGEYAFIGGVIVIIAVLARGWAAQRSVSS
ncbi:MAG: DMT family transporter [Sporomusaceae bacterium]|nr:DMT family transporter [Sporomusaceae bacterium]